MDYLIVCITGGEMATVMHDRVDVYQHPHNIENPRALFAWLDESGSHRHDETTLIVQDVPGRVPGAPATEAFRALAPALASGGWATPDVTRSAQTGWATWERIVPDTGRTERVHLGVLALMDASRTPLFTFADSAERIARNVRGYLATTGVLWRATAGVSGCAGIRAMVRDGRHALAAMRAAQGRGMPAQEPRWRWDDKPMHLRGVGDLRYSHNFEYVLGPNATGYVHVFDVRSMYLAAAHAAVLGFGKPQRGVKPFDHNVAGYWLIDLANDLPPYTRPWVVDYLDAAGPSVWVTSPVLSYLNGKGINPEILDAYTSPSSTRLLRPWAERLTTGARINADHEHPNVRAAWKRTYTETVGMMNAPGGSICRPDWRDTIMDLARVNMVRKLDAVYSAIGKWPFTIYTDAAAYHWPDPELPTEALLALGVIDAEGLADERIGKFKLVETIPAADYYHRKGAGR